MRFPIVTLRGLAFLILLGGASATLANGLLRPGTGARAMAMGGHAGLAADALAATTSNPGLLAGYRERALQVALSAASLDAEFSNARNPRADADGSIGLIPDLAWVEPLTEALVFGASLGPAAAIEADWTLADTPGTLGVDWGTQRHRSRYVVLRGALGLGFRLTPRVDLGVNLGVLYNENRLQAPYIFQSHPALAGLKVLVDLDADDIGLNAGAGLRIRPTDELELGLAYTTATTFHATGDLEGDLSALGLPIPPGFRYDVDVRTGLPQLLSASVTWRARPELRVGVQLDWVDWSDSFHDLPLRLSGGSNAGLNSVLGTDRIDDVAPLAWRDRFVVRTGAEYRCTENLVLRAGYSYGAGPVPAATLTPMTAAVMEHAVGAGLGWRLEAFQVDVAWQWQIPNGKTVTRSGLLAGEYSNSRVDVGVHWLGVTLSWSPPGHAGN